jgi:hypothetical protein
MKTILNKVLTLIVFLSMMHTAAFAQQNIETEIRTLEKANIEALLKGDTLTLYAKLWSPDLVVHSPSGTISSLEGTKLAIRAGLLSFSSFEQVIEKITILENTAIVMGKEIQKPIGNNKDAGKTVTRRFTNIWMGTKAGWRNVARHSNITSID